MIIMNDGVCSVLGGGELPNTYMDIKSWLAISQKEVLERINAVKG